MKALRIFLSSPGDVIPERRRASIVIDKLRREYARFFAIEPYLWESEPMLASGHFQDIIEPPSSCDILVLILWSRLGTPLPLRTELRTYQGIDGRAPVTGTEWEFEEALTARQSRGAPDLLAYRNTQPASTLLNDRERRAEQEAQWDALEAFWARHFESRGEFRAAYSKFDSLDTFDAKLEADLRNLIERRIKALEPAAGGSQPLSWFGNPFRGLQAYEFAHAPVFFGREAPIKRAIERLVANEAQGSAFLLVLGASGSGKSSLVRAGVLPRLFAPGVVSGIGQWRRAIFRPGDGENGLFKGLARALIAADALPELIGPEMTADDLGLHLRAAAAHPDLPFRSALERIAAEARADKTLLGHETVRLVLIIDQLEELFTTPGIPADDRNSFVSLLTALARSRLVWVIATMRSDFWHRAAETPVLVELAEGQRRIDLLAPDQAEVAEMIRQPAIAAGLTFEVHSDTRLGLDAVLTEAAAGGGGVLPLLSFVLDAQYQRDVEDGDRSVLTFASYEAVGKLHGAIGNRAEELYQSLTQSDPEAADALSRLLRKLVTISTAGDEPTARTASFDGFAPGSPELRLVEALLHPSARLLVSEGDGKSARIRLAHEALIRNWPRAVEQLQRDRHGIKIRARLETQELLWREAPPRDKSKRLLTGLALAEGLDLTQRWKDELSPQLHEFVAASSRQEKGRLRRFQIATAAFACLSVIAVLAAVWAYRAQNDAVRQADIALASALTAHAGSAKYNEDALLPLSSLLLIEAVRRSPSFESVGALRDALALLPKPVVLFAHTAAAHTKANIRASVDIVAISPDAKYLATATRSGSCQVWEIATGRQVARISGHGAVSDIAFSPDGKYVACVGYFDSTARVFEVGTGQEVTRVKGTRVTHGWPVTLVATRVTFTSDGKHLVTASYDGIRVWETETGREVSRVTQRGVNGVAFSASAEYVAMTGDNGIARVWEIATGRQIARMTNGSRVHDIAFSLDGKYLAIASDEEIVRVWESTSGREIMVTMDVSRVRSVSFSPDGKYLAAGGRDYVRVWNLVTGREISSMKHEGAVYDVVFNPDGKYLATASADHNARVWEVTSGREVARMTHSSEVTDVAYSPDGQYLATSSEDGTARMWEAVGEREMKRIGWPGSWVDEVGLSANGQYFAAIFGRNARVWDLANGREVAHVDVDAHSEVTFSADGNYFVTFSHAISEYRIVRDGIVRDGIVRVLETIGGREVARMMHGETVRNAALSPDGKHLVTASLRTARVWDATSGNALWLTYNHDPRFNDVAYSPDGDYLATASDDGKVRVWESLLGRHVASMTYYGEIADVDVAFSPDGQYLIVSSAGGYSVWKIANGGEVSRMIHQDLTSNVTFGPNPTSNVTFSPDGKYLAIANSDAVRVREALSGHEIARVFGVGVDEATFSSDGKYLATSSYDGTAQLTLLRSEDLTREACTRLTRNLTREEWRLYLPNKPYRKTCPNLPGAGK